MNKADVLSLLILKRYFARSDKKLASELGYKGHASVFKVKSNKAGSRCVNGIWNKIKARFNLEDDDLFHIYDVYNLYNTISNVLKPYDNRDKLVKDVLFHQALGLKITDMLEVTSFDIRSIERLLSKTTDDVLYKTLILAFRQYCIQRDDHITCYDFFFTLKNEIKLHSPDKRMFELLYDFAIKSFDEMSSILLKNKQIYDILDFGCVILQVANGYFNLNEPIPLWDEFTYWINEENDSNKDFVWLFVLDKVSNMYFAMHLDLSQINEAKYSKCYLITFTEDHVRYIDIEEFFSGNAFDSEYCYNYIILDNNKGFHIFFEGDIPQVSIPQIWYNIDPKRNDNGCFKNCLERKIALLDDDKYLLSLEGVQRMINDFMNIEFLINYTVLNIVIDYSNMYISVEEQEVLHDYSNFPTRVINYRIDRNNSEFAFLSKVLPESPVLFVKMNQNLYLFWREYFKTIPLSKFEVVSNVLVLND